MIARRRLIQALVPAYLALITGVPCVIAGLPLFLVRLALVRLLFLLVAPWVLLLGYVATAACLSRATLRAIVPGHFPRELGHDVYGPRRLYALCWTAVYYCRPAYHAILAIAPLKVLVFRMFGYRGSTAFTTYPDTWLRDLPLLTVGEGAYLSNKATISPNMCLRNGKILIAPVSIGSRSMVGHGTLIAPGVTVGSDCEIGVGGALGVRVRIGDHTVVGHVVSIDHGVVVGAHCEVGSRSYVGRETVILDGITIPTGAVIPAKLTLRTQADVRAVLRAAGGLEGSAIGASAAIDALVEAARPSI